MDLDNREHIWRPDRVLLAGGRWRVHGYEGSWRFSCIRSEMGTNALPSRRSLELSPQRKQRNNTVGREDSAHAPQLIIPAVPTVAAYDPGSRMPPASRRARR